MKEKQIMGVTLNFWCQSQGSGKTDATLTEASKHTSHWSTWCKIIYWQLFSNTGHNIMSKCKGETEGFPDTDSFLLTSSDWSKEQNPLRSSNKHTFTLSLAQSSLLWHMASFGRYRWLLYVQFTDITLYHSGRWSSHFSNCLLSYCFQCRFLFREVKFPIRWLLEDGWRDFSLHIQN